MAISFPIELPDYSHIKSVVWRQGSSIGVSRSPFTFQTQVQVHQGQALQVDITTINLLQNKNVAGVQIDQTQDWIGWLLSLNGTENTFLLRDVLRRTPTGTGGGTPLVNGASQTGNTLITDGWNNSELVLKRGDMFEISSRHYIITQDVNSDGSGNATLDFYPRLRTLPANNAPLNLTDAKGTYRLLEDENIFLAMDERKLGQISFSAVEAL